VFQNIAVTKPACEAPHEELDISWDGFACKAVFLGQGYHARKYALTKLRGDVWPDPEQLASAIDSTAFGGRWYDHGDNARILIIHLD
jgi:hypothetical protein